MSALTPCSDEWKVVGNKHSIPCSGSCICTCGTDFPFPCECHQRCRHLAPNTSKHTPTVDCRCADCIAYDESSPL